MKNTYAYCEETVNIWMKDAENKNTDELNEEIDDVKGSISNEEIWLNGSSSHDEKRNHMQNIADLTEYLSRLENVIRTA